MPRTAHLFLASSLGLSISLALAAAHAGEEYAPYAEAQTIEIHAEPRVRTSLLDRDRTVHSCDGDCVLRVRPGIYRVRAEGDFPTRTIRLGAGRDARLDVEPGDSTVKWGGLALGIVGTVTMFVGFIGLIATSGCIDECPSSHRTTALVLLGGGAAATAIGWVGFGTGGTHIEVGRRRAYPTAGPMPVAFGVVPTRGGAFGAIGFAF